jgi:hypothetical protein
MEQVIDWLNENELRAYPLLDDPNKAVVFDNVTTWIIPDNFILDLQLVATFSLKEQLQLNQNLVEVSSPVFLKKIALLQGNSAPELEILFGTSSQDIETFHVADIDSISYPYYSRTPGGCLLVLGEGVLDLLSNISIGSEALVNIPVEPSVCTQFNDAWLGVNSLRTRPEKVSKNPLTTDRQDRFEPALPIENSTTTHRLNGDVKLLAGYNFRVGINDNLIDLQVGFGYGLVMNCNTSFIPSRYLDCDELVSYINGVPPDDNGNFRLNPGTNINITSGLALPTFDDEFTEESNANSLFIGLTFKATDLCAPVNLVPTT